MKNQENAHFDEIQLESTLQTFKSMKRTAKMIVFAVLIVLGVLLINHCLKHGY